MPEHNLADCFDLVAEISADEDALIQGRYRLKWREMARRARNIAAWMKDRGTSHQAKVALYTYNHPAYMEGCYASFKAGLVPANVNYRYREEELRYLLENSDAEIVIVHEDFVPILANVIQDLPKLKGVLVVSEGTAPNTMGLPGAEDYDTVANTDRPEPQVQRSPDDFLFLYTGGTTGMPKGVMWRQGDLYRRLGGGGLSAPPETKEALREFVLAQPMRMRALIGPPLMHGTGWFTAIISWLAGGCVLTLDNPKNFDAADFWSVVERERPTALTIVGDSFAKPMLRELEQGRKYDLSSVMMITSSGVMWSEETKQGLLKYNANMMLIDAFSSSEAVGMGMSITTSAGSQRTGKFQLTPTTRLFDENLKALETAPGVKGLVGVGGAQPVGYYKDPAKSAKTFVEVPGAGRFSVPGDWAIVNDDGVTLSLLGRGSVCINTGGEKVFPEEVEEVVKRYAGVKDAVVVGVPDDKFGEAVTAVVSSHGEKLDGEAIRAFVKQHLAAYKAPKHVVQVAEVYRSPSGKADFKRTKEMALEVLGR